MIEKNLQSLVFVNHSRRISLTQRYFHPNLQISFFHFLCNVSISKNRAVIRFYLWDQYRLYGAFLLIIRWIIDYTKDERSRIYKIQNVHQSKALFSFFVIFPLAILVETKMWNETVKALLYRVRSKVIILRLSFDWGGKAVTEMFAKDFIVVLAL